MKLELINGMLPDCTQQEIFVELLEHFINSAKSIQEDPVVLILDAHYSHTTRNLKVINIANENNVYIMCLPPHLTNKMQPSDVAFISPFKIFYSQEITS